MKKLDLTKLEKLDNVTKILLLILIVALFYFIIFFILRPFFAPRSMMDMMNQIAGGMRTNNLLSIIIALIIGIIISFYLFKNRNKEKNEFDILRKVLSDDEKKILDEIKKAGEITQDSLRFRLDWSKAKVSTILTNLDKKGIVQRQRTGKTYNVHLQKVK